MNNVRLSFYKCRRLSKDLLKDNSLLFHKIYQNILKMKTKEIILFDDFRKIVSNVKNIKPEGQTQLQILLTFKQDPPFKHLDERQSPI
jgi:hypothetical protein